MNLVDLNRLKPHPKNQEYFGDVQEEKYEEIKRSIEANGIRDPLKVLPDYTVIAGHQRLRIAAELGLAQVPVVVCDIPFVDAEYLLIADNEERRGLDDDPMRKARRAKFLKEYWGVRNGGNRRSVSQNGELKTSQDVAETVGTTADHLPRLLKLNDLIEPLQALVSSGKLGTTAAEQLAHLEPITQQSLYNLVGQEIGQSTVNEIRSLRGQLQAAQVRNQETAELQQELSALKQAGRTDDQERIRDLETEIKKLQTRPPTQDETIPDAVQRELRIWKNRVSEVEAEKRQREEDVAKLKASLDLEEKSRSFAEKEVRRLEKENAKLEKGLIPLLSPEEQERIQAQEELERDLRANARAGKRATAVINLTGELVQVQSEADIEALTAILVESNPGRELGEIAVEEWEYASGLLQRIADTVRKNLYRLEVVKK